MAGKRCKAVYRSKRGTVPSSDPTPRKKSTALKKKPIPLTPDMQQIVSTTGVHFFPPPPPPFHLFKRLPAELRLKIWGYALSDPEKGTVKMSWKNPTPVPGILHACFESREQALKVYKLAERYTSSVYHARRVSYMYLHPQADTAAWMGGWGRFVPVAVRRFLQSVHSNGIESVAMPMRLLDYFTGWDRNFPIAQLLAGGSLKNIKIIVPLQEDLHPEDLEGELLAETALDIAEQTERVDCQIVRERGYVQAQSRILPGGEWKGDLSWKWVHEDEIRV